MNNHQPSPKIYLNKPCCRPKQLTPPSRTRKYGSDFFKILHYCYHMKRRLGKTMSNRAEIPDLELEHDLCMICGGKKLIFVVFGEKNCFTVGKLVLVEKIIFVFGEKPFWQEKLFCDFWREKFILTVLGKNYFFKFWWETLLLRFLQKILFLWILAWHRSPATEGQKARGSR